MTQRSLVGDLRRSVPFIMRIPTSREKEVQILFARGKPADVIAIRLGMKMSKVLALLEVMPKPLVP